MKSLDVAPADAWFKSSYSGDSGNSCVEVANLGPAIGLRDSKEENGPAILISSETFAGFVLDVSAGRFDN
ncbi:DUF397 domain-containing protein [Streptomyces sp. bgisy060]|uniref:DUF397 domain-containing protein n=1 Tax=Streptomyces sp. bgisy060 TaxID=3413775 RepID=UPI003EC14D78